MAKQSRPQRRTMGRVMHEYKHGELKTRGGRRVKSRRQAIAIGMHEAGASKYESPRKNKRNLRRSKAKEGRGKTGMQEREGKSSMQRVGRRKSSSRAASRSSSSRKSSARKGGKSSARKSTARKSGGRKTGRTRAHAQKTQRRSKAPSRRGKLRKS